MIKKLKHKITSQVRIQSIKLLDNPFNIWHIFYFMIYFQKTNYEFGGFKGYRFGAFQYLKNFVINIWENSDKNFLERNKLAAIRTNRIENRFNFLHRESVPVDMRVMTLFPSSYARHVSETKSPMLLNLIESAKAAGIYLHDYRSDVISDSAKFHDIGQMKKEWTEISKIIRTENISTLIILGHKNSFSHLNGVELLNLKRSYNVTSFVYLTDNWNSIYQSLIANWSDYADYIISYDYKVFEELPKQLRSKIVVWSNGPAPKRSKVNINSLEKFTLYISGTCYLNRWSWSLLISFWHKFYKSKINLIFDFNLQAITPNSSVHKSIAEYRENYAGKNLATVHFLERHPGISSVVASVHEGFAGGSLVIVQTSKWDDPLSKFFTPGKDYLVFSNLEELIGILEILEENREIAESIAQSGFERYTKINDPAKVWKELASNL
jgi:hypothetical protein